MTEYVLGFSLSTLNSFAYNCHLNDYLLVNNEKYPLCWFSHF